MDQATLSLLGTEGRPITGCWLLLKSGVGYLQATTLQAASRCVPLVLSAAAWVLHIQLSRAFAGAVDDQVGGDLAAGARVHRLGIHQRSSSRLRRGSQPRPPAVLRVISPPCCPRPGLAAVVAGRRVRAGCPSSSRTGRGLEHGQHAGRSPRGPAVQRPRGQHAVRPSSSAVSAMGDLVAVSSMRLRAGQCRASSAAFVLDLARSPRTGHLGAGGIKFLGTVAGAISAHQICGLHRGSRRGSPWVAWPSRCQAPPPCVGGSPCFPARRRLSVLKLCA